MINYLLKPFCSNFLMVFVVTAMLLPTTMLFGLPQAEDKDSTTLPESVAVQTSDASAVQTSDASAAQTDEDFLASDIMDMGALEEEASIFGNDTVYAASKYAQKKSEAPSSISVLTDEDIKSHGWRNLAEAVRSLPGFYSTYGRQYHQVGVRGFSRPGDYNSRILLLVNGQRMNENIFGSAAMGNDFAIDMDMIKQIEVIRGPSASVYGTSAFFAVVNVLTRTGKDIDGTEASVSAGSFKTINGRISYGSSEEDVDVAVSASAMNNDGQNYYFEEYDDPSTNNGFSNAGDGEKTRKLFAQVSTGNLSFQLIHSKRDKNIPTAPYGIEFNDTRAQDIDEHQAFDIKYSKDTDDGKNLLGRVYYNKYTYDGFFPYDYGPPDGVVLNTDHSLGELWGTEFQLSQPVQEHKLTYGADFRKNIHQDQFNLDVEDGTSYLEDTRSEQIWALYFQGEFKMNDHLVFNAGIRHDDYETYGGTTNPRLGFIYSPVQDTTWKLLYGQAFKAPTAFERYYNDDGESSKANTLLEPEEIETMELVFEQTVSDRTNILASVFRYSIDNLITQIEDPSDNLFYYDNVNEVTSTGLEVELQRKLNAGMELRIGGSWQDCVDKSTDQTLTNSPKYLGHLNFTVPLDDKKDNDRNRYTTAFEFLYVGESVTEDDNKAGSYGITNLNLTGHSIREGMDLSINIYNVFDRDYVQPASAELEQDTIRQDGRAFLVKLTTKF